MRRSVVLATITLSIWFSSATAGVENAKIALHVQAHTSKSVCAAAPTIPCFQYVTRGDVGVSYDVYLVVADATTDVGGLSCGIAYNANPSQGVDVYSWSFCGDGIEFPHEGPNGSWPSSESGTRLTWTDCPDTEIPPSGIHAVAGSFYVYAYGSDQLQVIQNLYPEAGPELKVATCQGGESDIPLSAAGMVGFSPSAADTGYNPCSGDAVSLPCETPPTQQFNFGSVGVGGMKDLSIRFSLGPYAPPPWQGTVTLGTLSGPDFSIVAGATYNFPSPLDTGTVVIRYAPTQLGQQGCVLFLGSVCRSVGLIGTGVLSPHPIVAPAGITTSMPAGSTVPKSLQVSNQGSAILAWSIFAEQGTLEDVQSALNAHYSEIISMIPNHVEYPGGIPVVSLFSTELSQPNEYLPTSNNVIRQGTVLGANARYFTRQFSGLFVFAADLISVSQLKATANEVGDRPNVFLSDATDLHHGYAAHAARRWGNATTYHRILISAPIPNFSTQYQESSPNNHVIYNLAGATRVLFLGYVTPQGAAIDVPPVGDLGNAVLNSVAPDPQWILTGPGGQVAPGGSGTGGLTLTAQNLLPGTYLGHVAFRSNSVHLPSIVIPVDLQVVDVAGTPPSQESRTLLFPASPNPFRDATRISYQLNVAGDVSLTVFNITGKKVRTLVRDALDAGSQEATWNGRDDAGRRVTPGIYVVRLRTPEFVASRRLLLMP